MIIYLLKSATCLALLLGFYHLILEKEKMHNFNRFFLLGSILFSFLSPLYTIYTEAKPILTDDSPVLLESIQNTIDFAPIEIVAEEPINYTNYILICYLFISLILLIRFARNLFKIISKIHTRKKIKYGNAVLVLVNDDIQPHTFWNYIFINKKQYENNEIEDELFTHELTHAIQKHTADVLVLELFQIAFWINPLFIFLKKAIQINHEFLADENVITQHKNTFQYQQLLLNKAAWKNEYYLASNLNYLVTKKRLKMMTTTSSPTKILLKKLAIAPLLVGFTFLFAQRVEAQKVIEIEEEPIETIVEQVPFKKDDIFKSELYRKYFYKNLTIQIKDENGNTISKKYSELNDEEKARLMPPPPLKLKKIVPTKSQFEALKDIKKFAVWIDGKVVKNEVLNKYKNIDFARYSNSHVYKNARSKRFPQENQAHLETIAYFNSQNKTRIEKFIDYMKEEYNIIEIEEIKEKPKKKKYNVPSSNGSKQSLINNLKIINRVQKDPKFNKGWFITIDNQKYYYTFDKNERIARYYKNGKLVELDIVKEYNKKHKIFEALKNEGKHYIFKKGKEKEAIDREFSDLGGMYYRMSRADKNKVSRPINPIRPYIRLMKNDVVFYKLRKDLTAEDKLLLPPPPAPHNASDKEKLRARMEHEAWKIRTGNKLNKIPPAPTKLKKKTVVENNATKTIVILVSKNGKYSISYNKTFTNFNPVTITTIDNTISKLNNNEIKNTFVFTKTKDLKKFRTKPSNSAEYQDDVEFYIMKSNIEYVSVKDEKGQSKEIPKGEFVLDNKNTSEYRSHLLELIKIFKKYNIKNITI